MLIFHDFCIRRRPTTLELTERDACTMNMSDSNSSLALYAFRSISLGECRTAKAIKDVNNFSHTR